MTRALIISVVDIQTPLSIWLSIFHTTCISSCLTAHWFFDKVEEIPKSFQSHWSAFYDIKRHQLNCAQASWKNKLGRRGLRYWPFERWGWWRPWGSGESRGRRERLWGAEVVKREWSKSKMPDDQSWHPTAFPPTRVLALSGSPPLAPSHPIISSRTSLVHPFWLTEEPFTMLVVSYVTFSLPSSPHAGWCHQRVFGITRLEQPLHGTWSEEL